MKKTALILVFLLAGHLLFAQKFTPGFIITAKGDSIKGEVFLEYKNGSVKSVHLKSTNQEQLFGVSDIKAAGTSFATVFSNIVEIDMSPKIMEQQKDTIFAELLVRGKLSLLLFEDRYQKKHFFVEDEEGRWQELGLKVLNSGNGVHFVKLPAYKGNLRKVFAGCPKIFPDIDRASYSESSLRKVFLKGLECSYGKQAPQTINNGKTTINYGVIGGISRTKVSFVESSGRASEYKFNNSVNLAGGMYLDLNFSKFRKFTFRSELLYKSYSMSSPEVTESIVIQNYVKSSGFVSASYLKCNLMVRYHFLYSKVSPYISVGYSPGFLLSHQAYANVTRNSFGSITYSKEPILKKVSSFEPGEFVGLGINTSNFGFELRAELSSGLEAQAQSSVVFSLFGLAYYKLGKLK